MTVYIWHGENPDRFYIYKDVIAMSVKREKGTVVIVTKVDGIEEETFLLDNVISLESN